MAKIDKLLQQLVTRGASLLRLDPGDPPVVELPGGHRVSLGGIELMGPALDGMAREILPEQRRTAYMRGEKITFEYLMEMTPFQVLCCRTSKGTRMVAARSSSTGLDGQASTTLDTLDPLIFKMLIDSGSDLYLSADEPPLVRIDGRMEVVVDYGVLSAERLERLTEDWVPPEVWQAYTRGQDTEYSHNNPVLPCRLRVTLIHDRLAPFLAVRVIPREIPDADTLGLPASVRRLANLKKGLVLLTGPMGSGKSTTQACLLNLANSLRKGYIITIQDAVEFQFPEGGCLIRQRESGRDPNRQKQAILAALRQAPDILAVGEIRDAETLDLALQVVQTGRMVIGTLPTVSILETLLLLAENLAPSQRSRTLARLAECLTAIVGHTLLPRMGGGQVAALETLFKTPAMAALIREDAILQLPSAMAEARYGQSNHDQAMVQLILEGKVDVRDAYLRCQDRKTFIEACAKAGIAFDPRGAGQVTED